MIHTDTFNIQRFQLSLKRYLLLNYKQWLIAFGAISGLLILVGVLTSIGSHRIDQKAFIVLSYVALYFGGAIITSQAFSEMHKPEKAMHYMILPATSFEKMFTAWLSTTLFLMFFAVGFFYAAYYVTSAMAFLLTRSEFVAINFFDAGLLKVLAVYLVMHSLFFLGAVYFKGFNFLKTILSTIVVLLAHSFIQNLFALLIMRDVFKGWINTQFEIQNSEAIALYMSEAVLPVIKIVVLYILPVFFLIVSFIRFKEREV